MVRRPRKGASVFTLSAKPDSTSLGSDAVPSPVSFSHSKTLEDRTATARGRPETPQPPADPTRNLRQAARRAAEDDADDPLTKRLVASSLVVAMIDAI